MNNVDHKLDAILGCLSTYYSKYINDKEIFDSSGDESYFRDEFVSVSLISAILDFTDEETVEINKPDLSALLKHLEREKLIISKNVQGEDRYKILPAGVSLIEKKGHVRKQRRIDSEYKYKSRAYIISLISIIIAIFTFVYTVFIKKG